MTLAAGLRFDQGILLCADSQYTYGGVSKTPGHKVFGWRMPHAQLSLCFAFAGYVDYAKTGIFEILKAVSEQNAATIPDVLDAMRSAHSQSYRRVFNHPRYETEPLDYFLIIAVWTPEGTGLYSSTEDVINPASEQEFVCRGTGDELFRYLLESMYRENCVACT